ncbi:ligand-effect modulator 3 family [Aspergillus ambiguus]|uniref:CDC50/LEM3 family protein n=1 Tax=Aspergillus ambiguus TaxID=176160 RepID=UPI003CCCBCBB
MSQTEVARTESFGEQEHRADVDADKKPKSRRPANTAFRQQRLKAWQPILTPKSVLPLFFIVGVIFAPIGGLLLWASASVQEIIIDYSECKDKAPLSPEPAVGISDQVSMSFKSTDMDYTPTWQRIQSDNGTTCRLTFKIPEDMGPPVFMYYRLTNFYQNHRRYVKSLDIEQLKGKPLDNNTIRGGSCDPLAIDPSSGKAYYPCGLIANSIFNDTISSPQLLNADNAEPYFMTNKSIAWSSDKVLFKKTQYTKDQVVPPPNWAERYPNGYADGIPNLNEDEELMVWMRTAALPTFSKLSRRNDTAKMSKGIYRLDILDRFPVTEYSGTKSILLSTRTVVGGQNPFMGIAYVVVGGICVLLGALFTLAHLIRPRKLGDHTYLTWNTEQESTAVATGRDGRFGSHAP